MKLHPIVQIRLRDNAKTTSQIRANSIVHWGHPDRSGRGRLSAPLEANRRTIVRAPHLLVEGPLQKYEGVIHR